MSLHNPLDPFERAHLVAVVFCVSPCRVFHLGQRYVQHVVSSRGFRGSDDEVPRFGIPHRPGILVPSDYFGLQLAQ